MGLLDKSVVPLSFLMRDVSNKNRLLKCIIRIVDKRFYFQSANDILFRFMVN